MYPEYHPGAGTPSALGMQGCDFMVIEPHDDDTPEGAFVKAVGQTAAHLEEAERIFNAAVVEAEAAGIDVDALLRELGVKPPRLIGDSDAPLA